MKHLKIVYTSVLGVSFLILLLGGSISSAEELSQTERNILNVIQGESTAFWDKDYDKWASYWMHTPYTRILGWWERGGISVTEGWSAISTGMKSLMESHPEPNANATLVQRTNLNFHIRGDMAFVTFQQHGEDTGEPRMDMPGISHESRVLEKYEGQWKLVYVGWLLVSPAANSAQEK